MLVSILSWIVIAAFVVWFFISILNQHRKTRKKVSAVTNRDICSLIPIWTFFAPNPGRTDLYLLYRDRDQDGNISDWREIGTARRKSWTVQWSPKRRIHKGIVDVSSNFTSDAIYEEKQSVSKKHVVGFPYLL